MWEWFTPRTARAKTQKTAPQRGTVFRLFGAGSGGSKKFVQRPNFKVVPGRVRPRGSPPERHGQKLKKPHLKEARFSDFLVPEAGGQKSSSKGRTSRSSPGGSDQGVRPPNGTGKNSKNRTSRRHGFSTFWCRKRGSNPHGIATTGF